MKKDIFDGNNFFKTIQLTEEGLLLKGRKGFPVGTVQTWASGTYIKTAKGWEPHEIKGGQQEKEEGKKKSRKEYLNEKPSEVLNVGEDIAGARRHAFDTYSLDQLEESGKAHLYINKKRLLGEVTLQEKKENETKEKPLIVYALKFFLKEKPDNDPNFRSIYQNFCKQVERLDSETSDAKSFLKGMYEYLISLKTSGVRDSKDFKKIVGQRALEVIMQVDKDHLFKNIVKLEEYPETAHYNFDELYEKISGAKRAGFSKGDVVTISSDFLSRKPGITTFDNKLMEKNKADIELLKNARRKLLNEFRKDDPVFKRYKNQLDNKEITQEMFNANVDFIFVDPTKLSQENQDKITKWINMISKLKGRKVDNYKSTAIVERIEKGQAVVLMETEGGQKELRKLYANDLTLFEKGKRDRKEGPRSPSFYLEAQVTRKGGKQTTGDVEKIQKILREEVGLRGIQYGNALETDDRIYHTRWTLDAFNDLSDILGMPVKQISLNGMLGIAFAARGSGKKNNTALAHYEPLDQVINLTKSNGFGSLAHEWGHALDNITNTVIKQKKRGEGFNSLGDFETITVTPKSESDIPHGALVKDGDNFYFYDKTVAGIYKWKKLKKDEKEPTSESKSFAFRRLPREITVKNGSPVNLKFKEIADKLKGEMGEKLKDFGPYWSKKDELFARAFECYVSDKLESMGRKNTYLASVEKTKKGDGVSVYPQGEFRKEINKHFDELFKMIKESEILLKAMEFFNVTDKDIILK